MTVGGADSVAMVPPKSSFVPTASQLAVLAHDTATRDDTPRGAAWLDHVAPPVVDVAMLDPPTAVHTVTLTQLTPAAAPPVGVPRSLQWAPPFVVAMTCEPATMQAEVLGQEIPLSAVTPLGTVCGAQVIPPVTVLRMAGVVPPDEVPSAVQCCESAQDMPAKLVTVLGKV
jgi:hypothetical protein